MNITSLWNSIVVFINTNLDKVIAIAVSVLFFLIYTMIKGRKVKLLISNKSFKDAKLFKSHIDSTIAISKDGLIGIVDGVYSSVINIKDINSFGITIDGNDVFKNIKGNIDDVLFNDAADKVKQKLKEETKDISLFIVSNNDVYFGLKISLLNFGKYERIPSDEAQDEIMQLLYELRNIDKNVNKS